MNAHDRTKLAALSDAVDTAVTCRDELVELNRDADSELLTEACDKIQEFIRECEQKKMEIYGQ